MASERPRLGVAGPVTLSGKPIKYDKAFPKGLTRKPWRARWSLAGVSVSQPPRNFCLKIPYSNSQKFFLLDDVFRRGRPMSLPASGRTPRCAPTKNRFPGERIIENRYKLLRPLELELIKAWGYPKNDILGITVCRSLFFKPASLWTWIGSNLSAQRAIDLFYP